MKDHRRTLEGFLRTDLLRLEGALDEVAWSPGVAERLTHFLRFAAQAQAVLLEGKHPHDAALRESIAAIAPQNMDEALDNLSDRFGALIAAIARAGDTLLDATVLDPHGRNLPVVAHLYDLCRASAMLVEWANGVAAQAEDSTGRIVFRSGL